MRIVNKQKANSSTQPVLLLRILSGSKEEQRSFNGSAPVWNIWKDVWVHFQTLQNMRAPKSIFCRPWPWHVPSRYFRLHLVTELEKFRSQIRNDVEWWNDLQWKVVSLSSLPGEKIRNWNVEKANKTFPITIAGAFVELLFCSSALSFNGWQSFLFQ